jgi:hypothetical protein
MENGRTRVMRIRVIVPMPSSGRNRRRGVQHRSGRLDQDLRSRVVGIAENARVPRDSSCIK